MKKDNLGKEIILSKINSRATFCRWILIFSGIFAFVFVTFFVACLLTSVTSEEAYNSLNDAGLLIIQFGTNQAGNQVISLTVFGTVMLTFLTITSVFAIVSAFVIGILMTPRMTTRYVAQILTNPKFGFNDDPNVTAEIKSRLQIMNEEEKMDPELRRLLELRGWSISKIKKIRGIKNPTI